MHLQILARLLHHHHFLRFHLLVLFLLQVQNLALHLFQFQGICRHILVDIPGHNAEYSDFRHYLAQQYKNLLIEHGIEEAGNL